MSETRQLVALSKQALARGERLCLATVVHIEGSAYRKPGARMLVTSGGQRAGTISGGCLESEVGRKAWWLTAHGARVERYSSFVEEDGSMPYGLGCGGTISLLLEQGEAAEAVLAALERVLETREPAVVVMALGEALRSLQAAGTQDAAPREEASRRIAASCAERVPGMAEVRGMFRPATGTLAVFTLARAERLEREEPGSPRVALAPAYWNEVALDRMAPHARGGSALLLAESVCAELMESVRAELMEVAQRALSGRRSLLLDAWLRECAGPAAEGDLAIGADSGADFAIDSGAGSEAAGDHANLAASRAPAYFVEYVAPPPALSIFGAGDDAQPVAALAGALGWRVSVLDGRAHLARRERFPQATDVQVIEYADPGLRAACGMSAAGAGPETPPAPLSRPDNGVRLSGPLPGEAAVVLTHSYEQDRALLRALLPLPLCYLGILGPRHRTERLLAEVAPLLGLSIEEGFARLHSPVGLDLGASDPATVALSIIAEVQAVLHGRAVVLDRAAPALAEADVAGPKTATKVREDLPGQTRMGDPAAEEGDALRGAAVLAAGDLT